MHLFEFSTLLYLSFHAIAGILLFISIMGIPGNPDETKPRVKLILKVAGFFLVVAWRGLPALAVASILAFLFHYDAWGKMMSYLSLGIGFALFVSLVLYYSHQSKA